MWFQKPPLGTPMDWGNPLNDGVVLHLAMNEGHGDKVQDLSMNGNHGTLHNFTFPPTVASGWNPGQTGVGLNLDGIDNYIDCGNNQSLDITEAITVGAMVKLDPTINSRIIAKWDGSDSWILESNNVAGWRFWIDTASGTEYTATTTKHNTNWHHIIATYDGINIRLYVDGAKESSHVHTTPGNITTNTHNLYIGVDEVASGSFLNDSIDQVRVQNRALTPKEVKDYYINPWQVYLDD